MSVSIVTINANGLRDIYKRYSFLFWLSRFNFDIVCLQEVHVLSSDECVSWFGRSGFKSVCSPGSNRSRGTVVLFKPLFALSSFSCDTVVSIYAPNTNPDRDNFFAYVESQVDPSVHTVLCGDFNCVFDRSLDRRGSSTTDYSRESSSALASLFRECCVLDMWRQCHPADKSFTWTRPDGSISSRINLIGVPFAWASFVQTCVIIPCPFSEHSLVSVTVNIPVLISLISDTLYFFSVSASFSRFYLLLNCS